jgi:transcription-repair coupling factor (superfamily II helicase)
LHPKSPKRHLELLFQVHLNGLRMLPKWLKALWGGLPVPKSDCRVIWHALCAESAPILTAGLIEAQALPVLIITPSLERAERWLAVLLRLGIPESRLVRVPPALTPIMEPTGVEREVLHERIRAMRALLRREPVCLIVPLSAAMQRTMPPAQFEAECLRLGTAAPDSDESDLSNESDRVVQIEPEVLVRRLLEAGYEYEEPVRLPGHFARRGGIVDVFPMGAGSPVRIEFFGDEIVSLRRFDPVSQRSISNLRTVLIPPAREVPMGNPTVAERVQAEWEARIAQQPTACQTTLRENLEADLQPLAQGVPFDRLEIYLPWLVSERACLLDYLPKDALLLLEEPLQLQVALERLHEEVQQSLDSRASRGDIIPLQAGEYLEAFARLHRHRTTLVLESGLSDRFDGSDGAVAVGTRSLETTRGRLPDLWNSLRRWHEAGYRIVIATDRPHQVKRALQEAALPWHEPDEPDMSDGSDLPEGQAVCPLLLWRGNLGGGFVWDAQRFALITDAELFERNRLRLPPRRFNEGIPITSIMDLQPGDYVVHIHHGIGIFRGLTTLERDGARREYLLIEYAHPDRIFVPTDQLDRIQKYIAPDDQPPEIHRLNSIQWMRRVAQARRQAREVALELLRLYALREKATRPPCDPDTPWQEEMEASFPYIETPSQLQAIQEVKRDLESPHPMDRLLVGDVGFGKTEVALRAAFKTIMSGRQVALLCPTTVLAYQHWQTFLERFEPFGVQVELLSRLISPAEQKRILHGLKTGAVDMVIGTHRLLSRDVQFKNLGLVIIDEEQRFGVMQKERFKQLRGTVDVLSMSATPIPRTLYMALTEIRDMSLINDPPPGRLPIRTYVLPRTDWTVREAILRELQREGQVFYVVPRVQGIEHVAEHLKQLVPHARIAVAHGQLPAQQMESTVLAFYQRRYDVLVSTTIIENGLDMPNVNTLIVEDAERFGLAQLYQLRGRVGRSDRQAYAYFLFKPGKLSAKAEARLQALKEFSHLGSGFALALRDLEIRGAGNLLGEEQHGAMRLVGFELYQAMLREAIRQLRSRSLNGENPMERVIQTEQEASLAEEPLPPIQLPLDAYIPSDYIASEAQRLGYYKRIAGSRTRAELKDLVRELRDRYGDLPTPLKNLLRLMEVRVVAHEVGVATMLTENGMLRVQFKPDRYLKASWQLALQKQFPSLRTQPEELSLPLGKQPLERLLNVLNALKSLQQMGAGTRHGNIDADVGAAL